MVGPFIQMVIGIIGVTSYFNDSTTGMIVAGSGMALILLLSALGGGLQSPVFLIVLAIVSGLFFDSFWAGMVLLVGFAEIFEGFMALIMGSNRQQE